MSMVGKAEFMIRLAKDIGFAPDPEAWDMMDQAYNRLSRHMREEMNAFISKRMFNDRLDGVLLNLLFYRTEVSTAEQLLEAYKAENPIELAAAFAENIYWLSGDDWLEGHALPEVRVNRDLLYRLVGERPLDDRDYHESLLEFIRYPEELKRRTEQLLEAFLEYGYQPFRDRLRELGELGAEKYRALFRDQPEKALELYAKSEAGIITKPTRVHVSYIAQVRFDFRHIDEKGLPDWLVLGYLNDAQSLQQQEKDTVEKFLKVVSDKRRMDIIDLLKKEKRYAGELAHIMELTPAAINYHTNLLIDLNLIRITREEGRIYYELNAERLSSLLDLTKRVLLQ